LLPFLQAVVPDRRLMGMSIGRYTYVGVLVSIALAAAAVFLAGAASRG
jgi:hypothetical protein